LNICSNTECTYSNSATSKRLCAAAAIRLSNLEKDRGFIGDRFFLNFAIFAPPYVSMMGEAS